MLSLKAYGCTPVFLSSLVTAVVLLLITLKTPVTYYACKLKGCFSSSD